MPTKNAFFTILVLDCEYCVDSVLGDFLKSEGYPVIVASSAEEALTQTRDFEPDLILVDCELKGVHCLTLLPELLLEHPDAAVILLASRPKVSNVVEAMRQGAVDFFERPYDLGRLKEVIELQKSFFKRPQLG